jgi:hypothetical protein
VRHARATSARPSRRDFDAHGVLELSAHDPPLLPRNRALSARRSLDQCTRRPRSHRSPARGLDREAELRERGHFSDLLSGGARVDARAVQRAAAASRPSGIHPGPGGSVRIRARGPSLRGDHPRCEPSSRVVGRARPARSSFTSITSRARATCLSSSSVGLPERSNMSGDSRPHGSAVATSVCRCLNAVVTAHGALDLFAHRPLSILQDHRLLARQGPRPV